MSIRSRPLRLFLGFRQSVFHQCPTHRRQRRRCAASRARRLFLGRRVDLAGVCDRVGHRRRRARRGWLRRRPVDHEAALALQS